MVCALQCHKSDKSAQKNQELKIFTDECWCKYFMQILLLVAEFVAMMFSSVNTFKSICIVKKKKPSFMKSNPFRGPSAAARFESGQVPCVLNSKNSFH